jgi:threonine/homoserine/homoserine lactone efflux protein
MTSLWINLLSLSIASAMGPGQILFDTLLLRSPDRGALKAGSFVGGMTTVRLLQGIVFGFIFTGVTGSAGGSNGSQPGVITSTLLLVLGIILLITAYRQWQQGENPDAPPPKWLTMIDSLTPVKSFGIGFVLVITSPNLWVFTLSAIAVISEAQLSRPDSISAFLLFVLVAELLVLVPILIRIIVPQQATKILNDLSTWLTQHNHRLTIGVSLVFGLLFLVKGVSGFLNGGSA